MNICSEYPVRRKSHTRNRLSIPNQRSKPVSALIFPRRKLGQSKRDEDARPVWLTSKMIDGLADGPLSRAAKSLGISPTALKKACRTLGVERWPYLRNPKCGTSTDSDSVKEESSFPSPASESPVDEQQEAQKKTASIPPPAPEQQPSSWIAAIKQQPPFAGLVSDPFDDRNSLIGDEDFRFYFSAHEKASWAVCENPDKEQSRSCDGVDFAAVAHIKPVGEKNEDTGMSMGEHCLLHAKLAISASLWVRTPELEMALNDDEDFPSMYQPFALPI